MGLFDFLESVITLPARAIDDIESAVLGSPLLSGLGEAVGDAIMAVDDLLSPSSGAVVSADDEPALVEPPASASAEVEVPPLLEVDPGLAPTLPPQ